jgi:hypothetical protein
MPSMTGVPMRSTAPERKPVTAPSVHHPIFARVFDRLSRLMERELARHRQELLAGLSGRVLEIGAGNGMNFQHYPRTVDEHVRSTSGRVARLQERLDRSGVWPRLAGGCHCGRETASTIAAAGFAIEHARDFNLGPAWSVTNPHVLGRATIDRLRGRE